MSLSVASFAIATLSLIVSIVAFSLGKEGNQRVPRSLGIPFLFSTIFFGLLGFFSVLGGNNIPSITSSPSPQTTETSESPASVIGGLLYSEDFEDGIENGITYISGDWNVTSDNDGNMVYGVDNRQSADYASINIGLNSWKNYTVEYRVKMLNLVADAPEVILYFGKSPEGLSYVQAFTPYHHVVSLFRTSNGSDWQPLVERDYSFESGRWYEVQVKFEESRLQVYVNGQLEINTTDSQINSGSIAFQAAPGSQLLLDDIHVQEMSQ